MHQRAIGKLKAKCKYSQRHVNRTQQAQADTLKTSAVAEDHGTKPCKSSKKAQNQRSAGVNTIPSYTALNIPPLGNSALRREERDLSRKPVVQTECPPQMSSPPLFSQCCRVAKLPIRPTTADNSAESPVQATQKTPLSLAPPLVLHLSGLPGPRVDKTSRFIPSASLVAGASTVAVPIRKQPTKPIPHAKRPNSLPALDPTPNYLSRAFTPPVRLRNPQHFLLILDLNGTLLNRKRGGKTYHPRLSLPQFLAYCLANHSLLVWSSAVPANVHGVCSALFTPHQRSLLLGEWGRETFGLTSAQYKERVQVYKRLSRVWKNKSIQARHPRAKDGKRWGQRNTVLIDDSLEKARGSHGISLRCRSLLNRKKKRRSKVKCWRKLWGGWRRREDGVMSVDLLRVWERGLELVGVGIGTGWRGEDQDQT